MMHTIFYDAECAFCRNWVRRVHRLDKRELFSFKPQKERQSTMVLQEANGKTWVRGKAVLRIFWLLGGGWRLIGWLYLIPCIPDLIYRLVAKLRKYF